MISVLEQKYTEPTRPFSVLELENIRKQYLKSLKVGGYRVYHKKCNHFYNAKEHSRKENKLKVCFEKENVDIGNCSVCWKLYRTPIHIKRTATDLVESYVNEFYQTLLDITHHKIFIEKNFYEWLYEGVENNN